MKYHFVIIRLVGGFSLLLHRYNSGTNIFNRLNSEQHYILWSFFESITEEENAYSYFMQGGLTAHTAHYSINVLSRVFEDRLVSHRL